jgi:hypothetical protein
VSSGVGIATPRLLLLSFNLRRLVVVVNFRNEIPEIKPPCETRRNGCSIADFEIVCFEKAQPCLTPGPLCDFFCLLMRCDFLKDNVTSDNG